MVSHLFGKMGNSAILLKKTMNVSTTNLSFFNIKMDDQKIDDSPLVPVAF